ncbi:MAG: hypothetical protein WC749_15620 [Dehalococcoidia bacterium]
MKMKVAGPFLLLAVVLMFAAACGSGSSDEYPGKEPTPTTASTLTPTAVTQPTVTLIPTAAAQLTVTPTPLPAEPPECEADRVAIQGALDAYYAANGMWPTTDGKPGLIEWDKLVPGLLEKPPTTIKCNWQVSSDPEGQVCRSAHC